MADHIARYTLPLPSNVFAISVLVKRNLTKGTAQLTVSTPGHGVLTLSGVGVRRVKVTTPSSLAKVKLTVQLTGKFKRRLTSLGHVKVKVKVTFTPTGGTAASRSVTLVLKKRR